MGKVRKGMPEKALGKVSPNKLGVLNNVGKFTVTEISDFDDYAGWTEGNSYFNILHLRMW